MDRHCQLVYVFVTVRTTCYVRNNSDNQTLDMIIYQYYIDQYVRDNILQIQ